MDKKILLAIVVAAIVVGAVVAVAVLYQPESRTGTVYYDTSITVPNMKAALATGFLGLAVHFAMTALERRALRWHPSQRDVLA